MPYLATLVNCMVWTLYGLPMVHPNSLLVVTINGSGCVVELIYVIMFLIYSERTKRLKVFLLLLVEILFISALAVLSLTLLHTVKKRSAVVGTICALFNLMMYASPLTVMKMVITTKSVEYMPILVSLGTFGNGVTWTTYALIRFDPFIAIPNGIGLLLSVAQLILYATYYKSTKRQIAERKLTAKGRVEPTLSELAIEEICRDIYRAEPGWKIILLRYFNPVGAHPSGYIGEDPHGIPNNLMPLVQQVAVGRRPALTVFGNDYNTLDGTGVRDYIHIVDLAYGHVAALRKLDDPNIGCDVYNLGTGKGTSVLEMVKAFEKVSGKKIPLVMAGRRPGDAEIVYASTEKAERELNWKAKYSIEDMCRSLWNWACKNPYGYQSEDYIPPSNANGEI